VNEGALAHWGAVVPKRKKMYLMLVELQDLITSTDARESK